MTTLLGRAIQVDEAAAAAFLAHVAVLEFPDAAAHHYAGIRGHLKRKGYFAANTLPCASTIGANDCSLPRMPAA